MDIDYSSLVNEMDTLYKDLGGVSSFDSDAGLLEACVSNLAGWYELLIAKSRFSIIFL